MFQYLSGEFIFSNPNNDDLVKANNRIGACISDDTYIANLVHYDDLGFAVLSVWNVNKTCQVHSDLIKIDF